MSTRYDIYHAFNRHLGKKVLKAEEKNNFKKAYKYRTIMIDAGNKYEDILTKEHDMLVEFSRKLSESDYAPHSLIYVQAIVIWSGIKLTMEVLWYVIIRKGK